MIQRCEGFLQVPDGEDIWYETAGTGPALILSHGLSGNAAAWFQQVPYFAREFQIITWDQRGFGRSTNRTRQHGIDAAVADQCAVLDHLDIDHAYVIGHSMGGWVAVGTALADPSRVLALVLACTTAGLPPTHPRPHHRRRPAIGPSSLGVHPAIAKTFSSANPELAYLFQALGSFGNRPSNEEFRNIMSSYQFAEDALTALTMPVTFLCGEVDPIMPPAAVRDVATRIPGADVVEVAGAGHSAYFEQPEVWNRTVRGFIRGPSRS